MKDTSPTETRTLAIEGPKGVYHVQPTDRDGYHVETVEHTYPTERRARVAAHLLARYDICPQLYDYNAAVHAPHQIVTAGRDVTAAWFYLAQDADTLGSDYYLVAERLDVQEQAAYNYLSRFLAE